jgi:hypothetical protein
VFEPPRHSLWNPPPIHFNLHYVSRPRIHAFVVTEPRHSLCHPPDSSPKSLHSCKAFPNPSLPPSLLQNVAGKSLPLPSWTVPSPPSPPSKCSTLLLMNSIPPRGPQKSKPSLKGTECQLGATSDAAQFFTIAILHKIRQGWHNRCR